MPVYLLHFNEPYRHARHYLGSANDLACSGVTHVLADERFQISTARGGVRLVRHPNRVLVGLDRRLSRGNLFRGEVGRPGLAARRHRSG